MSQNELPPDLMENIREQLGLESDDTSRDQEIEAMSKSEQLDRIAAWNGLIGFGRKMTMWVEQVYKVELTD